MARCTAAARRHRRPRRPLLRPSVVLRNFWLRLPVASALPIIGCPFVAYCVCVCSIWRICVGFCRSPTTMLQESDAHASYGHFAFRCRARCAQCDDCSCCRATCRTVGEVLPLLDGCSALRKSREMHAGPFCMSCGAMSVLMWVYMPRCYTAQTGDAVINVHMTMCMSCACTQKHKLPCDTETYTVHGVDKGHELETLRFLLSAQASQPAYSHEEGVALWEQVLPRVEALSKFSNGRHGEVKGLHAVARAFPSVAPLQPSLNLSVLESCIARFFLASPALLWSHCHSGGFGVCTQHVHYANRVPQPEHLARAVGRRVHMQAGCGGRAHSRATQTT
jgi:hypothetical protein